MDGSSVYKQSGGVDWIDASVPYARGGRVVYKLVGGQEGVMTVHQANAGSLPQGGVARYAYLYPAPPSEPNLRWHLWSESKPEDGHWLCRIDNTGATWGSESGDLSSDEDDTVWWAYAPCSSKYGE